MRLYSENIGQELNLLDSQIHDRPAHLRHHSFPLYKTHNTILNLNHYNKG